MIKSGFKCLFFTVLLSSAPFFDLAADDGKVHVRVVEKVDILVEVKGEDNKDPYCELFIHFTNNTNLNITVIALELSFLDKDGSVLDRNQIIVEKLEPGKIRMASTFIRGSECSEFSSLSIEDIGALDCWIDGQYAPSTGTGCSGYFSVDPNHAKAE